MKLTTILFSLLLPCLSFANNLYDFDEKALDAEFAELTAFEEKIIASDFSTEIVSEIKEKSFIELAASEPISVDQSNELYMDWGSFAWGFCCCPVGFFVVAVSNQADHDMKTSYWIGVGANVVLGAITGGVGVSAGYVGFTTTGCCVY
jgi:hypothetical protein